METPQEDSLETVATNENRDDRSTWRATRIVVAAGEYDPAKQLSPEEVIDFKAEFNGTWDLVPKVCTHIVINMLLESEEDGNARRAEAEADGHSYFSNVEYATREDFAYHVGLLSAHWAQSLQKAISLPGSEWPEDMTPPATYIKAKKDMEELQKEPMMAEDIAKWMPEDYAARIGSVAESADGDLLEAALLHDENDREILLKLKVLEVVENPDDPEDDLMISEFGEKVLEACEVLYPGVDPVSWQQ